MVYSVLRIPSEDFYKLNYFGLSFVPIRMAKMKKVAINAGFQVEKELLLISGEKYKLV